MLSIADSQHLSLWYCRQGLTFRPLTQHCPVSVRGVALKCLPQTRGLLLALKPRKDRDSTGVTAKSWCGARGKGEDMVPLAGASQPVGHKVAQERDPNPGIGLTGGLYVVDEGRPQTK